MGKTKNYGCGREKCSCIDSRIFHSVADPGCLTRIPDPDFYPSRILDPGSPDPKTATKEKKICCHKIPFFCSNKFHTIENYLIFEMLKEKLGQFSKNYRTFYTKSCH
jgi:hypothetical protein